MSDDRGVDLFHLAFDHHPDASLLVSPDGRIAAANRRAEVLFGYAGPELIGEPIERLIPEQVAGHHVVHRVEYAERPDMPSVDERPPLRGRRKDSTEFAVDVTLSPLPGVDDPFVLCVVRDLLDRRRAQDEFRGLLESAPDPMVIVDSEGIIVFVNSRTEQVFGYSRAELLNAPVEILIPLRYHDRHPTHRRAYERAPRVRPMGADLQLYGRRADGSEFPVEVSLSPIESSGRRLVSSTIRDITDRKAIEQVTLDALREKEMLLKEIHHRVKNNLAVVSSLFYLQSTYTQDPTVVSILQDNQNRMRSMALVHETLYSSQNLAVVDFGAYANVLCEQLLQAYNPVPGRIALRRAEEGLSLGIDTAVPCGLILNELVTNALKHAFPGEREGCVTVQVTRHGEEAWSFGVRDDGAGLPASVDMTTAATLGLRLVRSLSRQIDAEIIITHHNPGTEICLLIHGGTAAHGHLAQRT